MANLSGNLARVTLEGGVISQTFDVIRLILPDFSLLPILT
jgi:hypothetical protein